MNAQQAENLRILIRHMETSVKRTLDMDLIEVCGAPACALGEAAVCPGLAHLNLQILTIDLTSAHSFVQGSTNMFRLFGMGDDNAWDRADVTPQEWAAEARKVLAENGYSMDDSAQRFIDSMKALASDPQPTWDVA